MPLIRGHHAFEDHFTQIPNAWLRDSRMSLDARGLLSQILSHKPGWKLSIASVAAQNNIGRDRVKRMIDELLKCGYLERSEHQEHDENGHLAGFTYTTKDPENTADEPYMAEPDKAEPEKVFRPPKNTISKKTISKKTIREERLPQDWHPSERLLKMFDTKWPDLDADHHVEQFKLYWWSSSKGKTDWDLTFQRWMNDEQKKAIDRKSRTGYREVEKDRQQRELDAWLSSLEEGEE